MYILITGELKSWDWNDIDFLSIAAKRPAVKTCLTLLYLFALSAFEGPLPLVLVLPHVVHQVALRHKLLLADVTGVRFLTVVFHPERSRVRTFPI